MRGVDWDGGIYGATDGDLRWDFTVTVRLVTSLLVEKSSHGRSSVSIKADDEFVEMWRRAYPSG